MSESAATALLVIPVLIILAFLLVLLRLVVRRDFKLRVRGFGVSVNLETDEDARRTLQLLEARGHRRD